MTVVYIVLGVAGLGGFQIVRAYLFPFKRCPKCKGTKRIKGMGGFKLCTRCDKDGKVRRWGAPGEGRLWAARTAAGTARAAGARAPGRSRSGTPRPRRGRRRTAAGAAAPGGSRDGTA